MLAYNPNFLILFIFSLSSTTILKVLELQLFIGKEDIFSYVFLLTDIASTYFTTYI